MKSNDKIPEDEMLLAEALAAAKARGLGWCRGVAFERNDGWATDMEHAEKCCALGGLAIAGAITESAARSDWQRTIGAINTGSVFYGNDNDRKWTVGSNNFLDGDRGESLGWAFRCAMTQDESDPATEALLRERGAL